jgi:hypothetical protein
MWQELVGINGLSHLSFVEPEYFLRLLRTLIRHTSDSHTLRAAMTLPESMCG